MKNIDTQSSISAMFDYRFAQKVTSLTLPKLNHKECNLLLRIIENYIEDEKYIHPMVDVYKTIKNKNNIPFNTIYLLINRLTRELSSAYSTEKKTTTKRFLLNLREKLIHTIMTTFGEKNISPESKRKDKIENAIIITYKLTLGRYPDDKEIDIWKNYLSNGNNFYDFLILINNCPESQQCKNKLKYLPEISDGKFIQIAFDLVLSRGASLIEIDNWRRILEQKSMSRAEIILSFFNTANNFFSTQLNTFHDGQSCWIMGTNRTITIADWHNIQQTINKPKADQQEKKDTKFLHRFYIKKEQCLAISALASMYRGGDFIERFMDNITSQDGFDKYCELVIVDADSPDDEYETISRYLSNHKNIQYIRCNYRIGIYDAWNVAAKAARGKYLTNTNLDDLRRHDSFLLQAGVLDNLPFVDVVYQDLYYTLDPQLSFDEIALFDLKTNLPVITPDNMLRFNSPHNAPMWRKKLHEEIGYFNTHYKSAGDYEFWMRCLANGKKFYKINDPHVIYYQNPKGLSTRPDTRGITEGMEITKQYCKKLVSYNFLSSNDEFLNDLNLSKNFFCNKLNGNRYSLTQEAMRDAARFLKFANFTVTKND